MQTSFILQGFLQHSRNNVNALLIRKRGGKNVVFCLMGRAVDRTNEK